MIVVVLAVVQEINKVLKKRKKNGEISEICHETLKVYTVPCFRYESMKKL